MKNCPHETLPVADHRSWIKVAKHLSSLLFHCARNTFLLLSAVATLLWSAPGLAITLDDGDYAYMPDGSTLGLLYVQHVESRGLYSKGKKISDDVKLSTDVQMLRFGMWIGGNTPLCRNFYCRWDPLARVAIGQTSV